MQADLFSDKSPSSLIIDLFSDSTLLNNLSRSLGKMRSNKANLECLDSVRDRVKECSLFRFENIEELYSKERSYNRVFDIEYQDSHYLVERFGLSKSSRKFIVSYDFSNSMDLVFMILAKSNPKYVRSMKGYDEVSRALLNLDLDNFNIPLNKFSNLDNNLSEYLAKLFFTSDPTFAFPNLLIAMMSTVVSVVGYVGLFLQTTYKCSLRSMMGPIGVSTSHNKIPFDEICLKYEGYTFTIPLIQENREEIF